MSIPTTNSIGLERGFDSAGYLAAHEAFRRCSDQREQVCDWFERTGLLEFNAVVPSVLSVGAGGGDIDCELIGMLGRQGAFAYDAIDRSGNALDRFGERCADLDPVADGRVWLHESDFEVFEPGHRYELVHFIHVVYALHDPRASMTKAYRQVAEGGCLVLVCSTDEGMNSFKREVFDRVDLPGRAGTVREADLLGALSGLEGAAEEFELIPSSIAVDGCFEGTGDGHRVLSFILQADFDALTPDERDEVLSVLDQHCHQRDGARYLSQPMLGVTVRKRQPAAKRSVTLNVPECRSLGALADVACFA